MNSKEFDDHIDQAIDRIRTSLKEKGKEYRRDDNPFHNFDRAAEADKCTPERSLMEIMTKHKISISDMVDDIDNDLSKGQPVWVRYKGHPWTLVKFDSFVDGKVKSLTLYKSTIWDEYSIVNPDPESIEARALDILRRIYDWGHDIDHEFNEFIKEIDSYEK